MPPPPPPPPPPPGPPPPGKGLPARQPAPANRVKPPVGALLSDISKGKQLKKAVTNDRSAPIIGNVSGSSGPSPLGSAPAVPGMAKAPGGLAPPIPGNRARSNSDQSSRDNGSATGMQQPPQLAGILAGGISKLKKRGGGVETGANRESSYTSDPESSRSSVPKPPPMAAPRPPTGAAPRLPPGRPEPHSAATTSAFIPSVANLRKTAGNNMQRPGSSASMKGPPPPIGKKPPPPPGSRKPSMPSPQAPPPPPSSALQPPTSAPPPPAAPPPPPSAAPRPPINWPTRSTAPIPPPTSPPSANTNGSGQSLAMQAAIRAAEHASPVSAPPPPPPNGPPSISSHRTPSPPSAAPPPPVSRQQTQQPVRSMLDPSSYTLSSNGNQPKNPSPNRNSEPTRRLVINDPRWKFQDESILPKPRDYIGGQKKYRAGRGSSVPLDLSAFH